MAVAKENKVRIPEEFAINRKVMVLDRVIALLECWCGTRPFFIECFGAEIHVVECDWNAGEHS